MIDKLSGCGCDLDGDVFYYRGKPVYINLKQIWHDGYEAGMNEALVGKSVCNCINDCLEKTGHEKKVNTELCDYMMNAGGMKLYFEQLEKTQTKQGL